MANHEITILKQQHDESNAAANVDNQQKFADMEGLALEKMTGLKVFSFEELQSATDNFSPSKMLGEGSNGQVFEGFLCGKHVAVKRLLPSERVEQADNRVNLSELDEEKVKEEFIKEIHHLGTVNHQNILSLMGFCLDAFTPLLVTEKLHSLQSALYEDEKPLMWSNRFQIALGVAKGLAYLHTGARTPMVHCDIKPGNILLDPDNLSRSYIADFGVVHLLGRDQSAIEASWYYGTPGYWVPEVHSKGEKLLSTKSDVYSFGKLLYALVTGKEDVQVMPWSLMRTSVPSRGFRKHLQRFRSVYTYLFGWFLKKNIVEATVASALVNEISGSARALIEASTVLRLIVLCTQGQAEQRPSMERVRLELESATLCQISWIVRTAIFWGIKKFRWITVFVVSILIPNTCMWIWSILFGRKEISSVSLSLLVPLQVPKVVLVVGVVGLYWKRQREIVGLGYWSADDNLMAGVKELDPPN